MVIPGSTLNLPNFAFDPHRSRIYIGYLTTAEVDIYAIGSLP